DDVEVEFTDSVNQYFSDSSVENFSLSMKYLLLDLKNDESSTNKIFAKSYPELDKTKKKTEIFNLLFGFILVSNRLYNRYSQMEYYRTFPKYCSFPCGRSMRGIYFKYLIENKFFADADEESLNAVPVEALAKFVIPQYYLELGMWDREILRADEETMNKLQLHWFENSADAYLN
ncbi:MAG: hypothetical protein KBS59_03270, partial [Clostridiales bacterium]|nr:hypothetical protein [Clostridiales bacterium]